MSSVDQITKPLVEGERLSRDEFLRRWELLPSIKNAELIGGVVYMPSPVSIEHDAHHTLAIYWLAHYARFTPGCKAGSTGTWLMLKDAPQPDAYVRILPEYGGQSSVEGNYASGAPELITEICLSSTSYDLGPKLELYRAAGVREYITVLLKESKVIWRKLQAGRETTLDADSGGILRSSILPGLWLDPVALLREDEARVMEILDRGLASPEHRRFIEELKAFRS